MLWAGSESCALAELTPWAEGLFLCTWHFCIHPPGALLRPLCCSNILSPQCSWGGGQEPRKESTDPYTSLLMSSDFGDTLEIFGYTRLHVQSHGTPWVQNAFLDPKAKGMCACVLNPVQAHGL